MEIKGEGWPKTKVVRLRLPSTVVRVGWGHFRLLFFFWIILSALFVTDDLCVLAFYHLRSERHAEEELDRALRGILGQLTARHYRHFLMTIRAG